MASAQVLPSSRKQEHLEAGKRRLEEFRKKKAADRAKKAAASSQVHASDVSANEKQSSNIELVRPASDDAQMSIVRTVSNEKQPLDTELVRPPVSNSTETSIVPTESMNSLQTQGNQEKQRDLEVSVMSYNRLPYKFLSDQPVSLQTQLSQEIGSRSSRTSFPGKEESLANESSGNLKEYPFTSLGPLPNTVANISRNSSGSDVLTSSHTNAASLLSGHTTSNSSEGFAFQWGGAVDPPRDEKMSYLENGTDSNIFIHGSASQMNDHPSTALRTGLSDFPNHVPLYSATKEAQPRRSRPSFLDSLNVSRASPIPLKSSVPEDSATSSSLTSNSTSLIGSSAFQAQHSKSEDLVRLSKSKAHDAPSSLELAMNSSVSVNNGENLLKFDAYGGNMERKPELFLHKQNEDFAALEQHIEDLTQEKFSLQRALEASRSLADSLAAENSSLTDNYNQQRGVVNQLKEDMEKLQGEINAQMAQLEFIKQEYANAQLECNAADERAKLLASEVIGLEEKALRLRSNELKLERQLENSQEEISLCRKKLSSLEKERQDLQSTISALQEEKKLLQSKLRKASASGKSADLSKSPANSKDMSTSTEDLETSKEQTQSAGSIVGSDTSSSILQPDILQPDIEASSTYLPPDQIRTIENINTLIVELAMEKDGLLKALASQTSENSKLKDLNKELSQKLETQTQRLELLAAQHMTGESLPLKRLDSNAMHETAAYADEGDEVVERVLGWIMKLFPGGPSRRRTSKLL